MHIYLYMHTRYDKGRKEEGGRKEGGRRKEAWKQRLPYKVVFLHGYLLDNGY